MCIGTFLLHRNSTSICFYANQYVSIRSHIHGNSILSYILTFTEIEYVSIVFHIHWNSVCIDTFLCWNSMCIDTFYVGIQYVSIHFNAENQYVSIRSCAQRNSTCISMLLCLQEFNMYRYFLIFTEIQYYHTSYIYSN